MRKYIPLLLSLPLMMSFTACSTTPEKGDDIVRFALRDDYIESWQEVSGGFEVHLNSEGQRKLTGLTRTHTGQEMEIYAGRVFLNSQTIHQTIRGQSMFVSVDDDVMEVAEAQMPSSKRSES